MMKRSWRKGIVALATALTCTFTNSEQSQTKPAEPVLSLYYDQSIPAASRALITRTIDSTLNEMREINPLNNNLPFLRTTRIQPYILPQIPIIHTEAIDYTENLPSDAIIISKARYINGKTCSKQPCYRQWHGFSYGGHIFLSTFRLMPESLSVRIHYTLEHEIVHALGNNSHTQAQSILSEAFNPFDTIAQRGFPPAVTYYFFNSARASAIVNAATDSRRRQRPVHFLQEGNDAYFGRQYARAFMFYENAAQSPDSLVAQEADRSAIYLQQRHTNQMLLELVALDRVRLAGFDLPPYKSRSLTEHLTTGQPR